MAVPPALECFIKHPDMFVQRVNYDTVVAFIQGFDAACDQSVLVGFREWLILKLKYGNNFAWPELFLRFAFPESDAPSTQELPKADPKRLVSQLFEALDAFWKEKDAPDGMQNILLRHAEWLRSQDWYQGGGAS